MKGMDENDWRVVEEKRLRFEAAFADAELTQMMTRERSPHIATEPGKEGNRAARRRQEAQARKARR